MLNTSQCENPTEAHQSPAGSQPEGGFGSDLKARTAPLTGWDTP